MVESEDEDENARVVSGRTRGPHPYRIEAGKPRQDRAITSGFSEVKPPALEARNEADKPGGEQRKPRGDTGVAASSRTKVVVNSAGLEEIVHLPNVPVRLPGDIEDKLLVLPLQGVECCECGRRVRAEPALRLKSGGIAHQRCVPRPRHEHREV